MAVSLEHLGTKFNDPRAVVLAQALDKATEAYLQENKSPSRKVNELDNRGSHFYLAMYWAQALADQDTDADLKAKFTPVAQSLTEKADTILQELIDAQGSPVDIKGYYYPDSDLVFKAMRPSATFNTVLESI